MVVGAPVLAGDDSMVVGARPGGRFQEIDGQILYSFMMPNYELV